jgi:hypothetical protein
MRRARIFRGKLALAGWDRIDSMDPSYEYEYVVNLDVSHGH